MAQLRIVGRGRRRTRMAAVLTATTLTCLPLVVVGPSDAAAQGAPTLATANPGGESFYVDTFGSRPRSRLQTVPSDELGRLAADVAPPRVAAAPSPLHTVTVVLVTWPGLAKDSMTAASLASTVNGAVDSYWNDNTGGAVDFAVGTDHGWVDLPTAPVNPCGNPQLVASAAASAVAWSGGVQEHLVVYAPSLGCGWAGVGTVGYGLGSGGWAVLNANASLSVLGHELGHNLGLEHSARATCADGGGTRTFDAALANCTVADYYDLYDIMALAHTASPGYLNPVHLQALGLTSVLSPATYGASAVTGSQTFDLSPRSATSGTRAVSFVDGDTYWVEYRADAGRDSWLSSGTFHAGVVVRRMPTAGGGYQSALLDASPVTSGSPPFYDPVELTVGQTVTTVGGSTITLDALSASLATVTISAPDSAPPAGVAVTALAGTARGDGAVVVGGSTLGVTWPKASDPSGVDHYDLLVDGATATTVPDDGSPSYQATVGLTPGSHTVAVRAADTVGNAGVGPVLTVIRDTTAPVVAAALSARLRTGAVTATGVPATVTWRLSDSPSGVRAQSLTRSGSSARAVARTATAARVTLPLAGSTWTAAATDWAGLTTATAAALRVVRSTEGAARLRGAWRGVRTAGAFDGRVAMSSRRGASATFTVNGRSVAWISSRGPQRGRAVVSLDGRAGSAVSLRGATLTQRQLVYAHSWPTAGRHTVTITVREGRVDLDGLVVIR